jgi:hypothetical protein
MLPWTQLEAVLHRDPGARGVASYQVAGQSLDAGELERSARSLAEASAVAIVTGFCIPTDSGMTAETDGPPGALYLARALLELGTDVLLLGDEYSRPLLEAGTDFLRLPRTIVGSVPFEPGGPDDPWRSSNRPEHCPATDGWVDAFLLSDFGRRLTHLVAIERCGPSHTLASLAAQPRSGAPPLEEFQRLVPPQSRNICHNMRGLDITRHTAKTHRLFEAVAARRPEIVTIGIGDGGNELGMGRIAWETLVEAIATGPAPRIACRIATQHLMIAGVSNWGGYALGLTVCHLRGQGRLAESWTPAGEQRLIEHLVREAGAVDGVTRRREPTVDGLPLDAYLSVLEDLGCLAGHR